MADSKNSGVVDPGKPGNQTAGRVGGDAKRVRKDYGYAMSDEERFALQTIRNAQKACKLLGVRVQSGKPINPDVLAACATLSGAMGTVLWD